MYSRGVVVLVTLLGAWQTRQVYACGPRQGEVPGMVGCVQGQVPWTRSRAGSTAAAKGIDDGSWSGHPAQCSSVRRPIRSYD